MFKKKQKEPKVVEQNRAEVAKALEILFAKDYISRKRLYTENFLRGVFFGAGGVIGTTLLIGLILWVLSLFDAIPFIGPLFDNARESLERGSTLN